MSEFQLVSVLKKWVIIYLSSPFTLPHRKVRVYKEIIVSPVTIHKWFNTLLGLLVIGNYNITFIQNVGNYQNSLLNK